MRNTTQSNAGKRVRVRRSSTNYVARQTAVDRLKSRYGGKCVKIAKRSRSWALKRSPHVFSKSQEAFVHQSYEGCVDLKLEGLDGISVSAIGGLLQFYLPEVTVDSWTVKSEPTVRCPGLGAQELHEYKPRIIGILI